MRDALNPGPWLLITTGVQLKARGNGGGEEEGGDTWGATPTGTKACHEGPRLPLLETNTPPPRRR